MSVSHDETFYSSSVVRNGHWSTKFSDLWRTLRGPFLDRQLVLQDGMQRVSLHGTPIPPSTKMESFVPISIAVHLSYDVDQACDLLLQIEAAAMSDQILNSSDLDIVAGGTTHSVPAESGVGERLWVHAEGAFECRYTATVDVQRPAANLSTLRQSVLTSLPGSVVSYLMPSRYCHPEKVHDFVTQEFTGLTGGALIAAARDWIERSFTYDPGASDAGTAAHDTLRDRQGVCRDYAHVLIAIARASAIPARMVSVYAPDVDPPDFHAVVEVYLDGKWHLVDATGMAMPETMVRIGVGRDAADISFMTAYGILNLKNQSVDVRRTE